MPLREIAPSRANDPVSMSSSQRQSQDARDEHEEARRRLKIHAEFQKQIQSEQAGLVNPQNDALAKKLSDADKLLDGTSSTRELNRNTAIFVSLTEMGVEQAKKLEKNLSKFTADAYVKKLKRKYCDDDDNIDAEDDDSQGAAESDRVRKEFDWAALGRASFGIFNSAPTVDFMTGPMALKPKERKVVQRAKKVVVGAQTTAQNVEDTEAENEAHTKLMKTLTSELLRKDHPCRPASTDYQLFWPFVLEDSLGETVLRMFATCHAAREGKISLSLNSRTGGQLRTPQHPEGELLIGPPRKIGAQGGGGGDAAEDSGFFQFIMSIDMAQYKANMAKYKDHVAKRRRTK
jgi:hypothetical protein|eukprot:COSAG02_NODE_7004_length_3233_cov_1.441927_3_plen_347_part_00